MRHLKLEWPLLHVLLELLVLEILAIHAFAGQLNKYWDDKVGSVIGVLVNYKSFFKEALDKSLL